MCVRRSEACVETTLLKVENGKPLVCAILAKYASPRLLVEPLTGCASPAEVPAVCVPWLSLPVPEL